MSEPLEIEPENPPMIPGPDTVDATTAGNAPSGNAPSGNPPSGNPSSGNPSSGNGPRRRRGLRVRTLVFGLLLGLVSLTVLVSEVTGDRVDGGAIAIVALIGAGVILLAGAVGAAGRSEV